MHEALIGSDLRLTTMLFLGVVGFVLLICAANVAGLLLARGVARSPRDSHLLGAGRQQRDGVIRQLITESLLFSVIGGLLGLAVGAAILAVAPSVIPEGLLPPAVTLSFDWRVGSFCFAAALFVGLLCPRRSGLAGYRVFVRAGNYLRQPDGDTANWENPRVARRRRSSDSSDSTLLRQSVAAYPPGCRDC